jgi:hypothetical protein
LTSAAAILKKASDFMCETIDAVDPFLLARLVHSMRSIKGVSEARLTLDVCETASNYPPIPISALLTPGFSLPTMVHRVTTKGATRRERVG